MSGHCDSEGVGNCYDSIPGDDVPLNRQFSGIINMTHITRRQRLVYCFSLAIAGAAPACGARTGLLGKTTTTFERLSQSRISSIDLLFMIDNSPSMTDKESVLADSVPYMLTQLVQPRCLDAQGNPVLDANGQASRLPMGGGSCPIGSNPEFNPVNDIHIGIVTSSLGDHGGDRLCTPGQPTSFFDANGNTINLPDDVNDKSHLVGTLARYTNNQAASANVALDPAGFLAWGSASKPPMTDSDFTAATGIFTDMVRATKEMGCGLEAQLEGWFRFLIDPVPPVFPIQKGSSSQAQRLGSDDALLAQRAAFLRPDSLVAILMLTDENDCSLRDTDVGWVATVIGTSIESGSDACTTNPNDQCCYSCTTGAPPSGCASGCADKGLAQDDTPYQANIRCFHQKRRFGYEFMYPTSRYVVGLTHPELCPDQTFGDMDCDCNFAKSVSASCDPGTRRLPNPLYSKIIGYNNASNPVASGYANANARADNSAVFLAGIVGVPWQDIGYLDTSGNLVYIPVADPVWNGQPSADGPVPIVPVPANGGGIWANIYGDDNANVVPQDPHMVESLEPRAGIAANDTINGGEWTTAYQDLEYACIYPLATTKDCLCDQLAPDYASCKYLHANDCCDLTFHSDGRGGPAGSFNKPLCNGRTQVNAKAYPGLREIAVLRDYALTGTILGNSIVASTCAADVRITSDKASPGYGYNPVTNALIGQLKRRFKGSCLARPISVDSQTGAVSCNLVEVVNESARNGLDCTSYCTANQRSAVSAAITADVTIALRRARSCDTQTTPPCSSMCQCLLTQASATMNSTGSAAGSDLAACQNADDATTSTLPPGYCYVDPSAGAGSNPSLVSQCPDSQRRILRFVGNNPTGTDGISVPLPRADVYLSCPAAPR